MYRKYFGLKRDPFSIAPDPRYLFMSERHREALAHLVYGLEGGGGFVLLTGEIGAGKTTVCRCFLEQVPRRCNVAYVLNPKQTADQLLASICDEFRIPHPKGASSKELVDAINQFLLRTHAVGQNNVLIIDEAQNLSPDVLEQLRLLTNLETAERKLLQIVLIGQPELRGMVDSPDLEQLAQRVIARYHLGPMSPAETAQYVRHRLYVAGLNGPVPFSDEAIARVHELSGGVPRRINLLCDRAMLGAFAAGRPQVDPRLLDGAADEVSGRSSAPAAPPASRRWAWVVAAAAVGAVVGAAVIGTVMHRAVPPAPAPVPANAPSPEAPTPLAAPLGATATANPATPTTASPATSPPALPSVRPAAAPASR